MGSVWVADHLALHNQVVVKFITGDLLQNPDALARFEREAAAAFQVKSPHVVQTFDHGLTEDKTPYIVMELLEGIDLGDHLAKVGRMAPAAVVALVTQLARALDRAHARGIVHRDIKPNNIFLSEVEGGSSEFFVKLLDFGIAKGGGPQKLDSGTRTGSVMGSPFYMSPEQIVGAKELGPKADLWAVGIVVFEALTGQRPYEADTMGALAIMVHSDVPPKPTAVMPSLPVALDAWFERACARAPEERFGSAREMAESLAQALEGPSKATIVANEASAARNVTEAFVRTARMEAGSTPQVEVDSASGMARHASVALPSRARTPVLLGLAALALAFAAVILVPHVMSAGGAPSAEPSAGHSPGTALTGATPIQTLQSAAAALSPTTSVSAASSEPPVRTSPSAKTGGRVTPRPSSSASASASPVHTAPPAPTNSNDIF